MENNTIWTRIMVIIPSCQLYSPKYRRMIQWSISVDPWGELEGTVSAWESVSVSAACVWESCGADPQVQWKLLTQKVPLLPPLSAYLSVVGGRPGILLQGVAESAPLCCIHLGGSRGGKRFLKKKKGLTKCQTETKIKMIRSTLPAVMSSWWNLVTD